VDYTQDKSRDITISELMIMSNAVAVEKGWWDTPRPVLEVLMLAVCELAEAAEEYRDGHALDEIYYSEDLTKPLGFPIEIADVFIRLADTCAHHGIDLNKALATKMLYNESRPYKHGKIA
jgi:NTP pyrophosphatase (non-canonical NTP hydrolase)